jgi:transposase
VLDGFDALRGRPRAIRCDNGPEFTSRHFLTWVLEWKVELRHIQAGKPFHKANKNDDLDAEAIAVQRPTMRFVPIKTNDQLNLQALYRVRESLGGEARCDDEPDSRIPYGARDHDMQRVLSSDSPIDRGAGGCSETPLSTRLRLLIIDLEHEWEGLETRIEAGNSQLRQIARQDDGCRRLMEIPTAPAAG